RNNNGVVDVSSPAVMPSEDAADNLAGDFCHKTGGGVALEVFLDTCFTIIQAAQSPGKARHAVPQGEQGGVIFGGHQTQNSFSHNRWLNHSVTCKGGVEDQVDQLCMAHAVSVC